MIFDIFKKKKDVKEQVPSNKQYPQLYEEEEIDILEEYISQKYGDFQYVIHEIISPDIHVDIAIIAPTAERDYYTLVTMGMGAHKMNVPQELSEYKLERAELVVNLPKEWDINNEDEVWYWPIRWLKILARLPIQQDTWLGFGHTIPSGEPVANDVLFNCMMLIDDGAEVNISEDERIIFYTMVPLYEEEMQYKITNAAEDLIDLLEQNNITLPYVVDKNRKNVCIE